MDNTLFDTKLSTNSSIERIFNYNSFSIIGVFQLLETISQHIHYRLFARELSGFSILHLSVCNTLYHSGYRSHLTALFYSKLECLRCIPSPQFPRYLLLW